MSLNTVCRNIQELPSMLRYLAEENRRETWKEQVDRVFDMHEGIF